MEQVSTTLHDSNQYACVYSPGAIVDRPVSLPASSSVRGGDEDMDRPLSPGQSWTRCASALWCSVIQMTLES